MRKKIPIWKLDVSLRGIAIIAVIINHSIYHLLMSPHPDFTDSILHFDLFNIPFYINRPILIFFQEITRFPVPLFVMLAGNFMAGMKLTNKTVIAQIKKLLIPFLFWSILGVIYNISVLGLHYNLLELFITILLGRGQSGYYFFPLIIQYYFISIITIRVFEKRPKATLALSGVLQFIWICSHYTSCMIKGGIIMFPSSWAIVLEEALFPRFLFFFVLGIYLKKNSAKIIDFVREKRAVILIGTIMSMFFMMLEHWLTYSLIVEHCSKLEKWQIINALSPKKITTTIFSFMTILTLLSLGVENYFSHKILKKIGKLSFSIFLLSGPLLLLFEKVIMLTSYKLAVPVFLLAISLCLYLPIILNEKTSKGRPHLALLLGNG